MSLLAATTFRNLLPFSEPLARSVLYIETMAYKHLIRTSEYPYHVMSRTNNCEPFRLPLSVCWEIFLNNLSEIQSRYRPEIVSFVLMPNHFHMLLWTPLENLSSIMNDFLRDTSKHLNLRSSTSNHVFGGRYKWCLIEQPNYLFNAYKYVYRNPVKAGLVSFVNEYEYSSLFSHNSEKAFPVRLHDKKAKEYASIPERPSEVLSWLNEPYHEKEDDLIRRALRRRTFCYCQHKRERTWVKNLSAER